MLDSSSQTVDFMPPAGLRNQHLQSVLASLPPRRQLVRQRAASLRAASEPVLIDCGAGVRLSGYFSPAAGSTTRGMVVMLHGWEGSADSTYILSVAPKLIAAGYAVFRLNFRDHGDSHHLNEELFHSCRLQEVVGAVAWIQHNFPIKPLYLAGFSLGGNFALRVAAAARAADLDIAKVVAICPVLDPAQTMAALDSGWAGYQRYFIYKWRRSLQMKQQMFPELYQFHVLAEFTNLGAMTEHFVINHTEYPDLQTYLSGYAITRGRLDELRVPGSILLADDDPVIPVAGLKDMNTPPALKIYRSGFGGHCGFIENMRLGSWMDNFVLKELAE